VQERRLHTRFKVHVDVQYQTAVVAASAPAHDLSPGGVFVETTVPLPVGTRLTIRPLLEPGDGLGAPTFSGKVIRTIEHGTELQAGAAAGMGVQFEVLTPTDREVLMQIVRKHAPADVAEALAPSAVAAATSWSAAEAAEKMREGLVPAGSARDTLVDAAPVMTPELAAAMRSYDTQSDPKSPGGDPDGGDGQKGKKGGRAKKRGDDTKK